MKLSEGSFRVEVRILPFSSTALALLAAACGIFISSAAELRPLSTDRPDTTEGTHTVDAGHFQFEMEIVSWTRDSGYRDWSFGQLNSKVGLDLDGGDAVHPASHLERRARQ